MRIDSTELFFQFARNMAGSSLRRLMAEYKRKKNITEEAHFAIFFSHEKTFVCSQQGRRYFLLFFYISFLPVGN